MLPQSADYLGEEWEVHTRPTQTYRMREKEESIAGSVDGQSAMRQAIYKALLTERFQYPIYSADYGMETLDLYGQPVSYVCPELERRITEALVCDERVTGVTDFVFDTPVKGALHAAFTVHTVFGDIDAEREVRI